MTPYLQNRLPRWCAFMALSLLGCLGVTPSWAATTLTILVLTTNAGEATERFTYKSPANGAPLSGVFYDANGKGASDNLAAAFGNTGTAGETLAA